MNRVFITLSFLMGVVVLTSNYLVQFPINYFDLNEILTYGAFSYPIAFLITDLANRSYGKLIAKNIVYTGLKVFKSNLKGISIKSATKILTAKSPNERVTQGTPVA